MGGFCGVTSKGDCTTDLSFGTDEDEVSEDDFTLSDVDAEELEDFSVDDLADLNLDDDI